MSDTLERAVRRLTDLPSPVRWSDVETRADDEGSALATSVEPVDGSRRGRVRAVVGLVAAAALLVVVLAAWPREGADQEVRTDPGVTASSALPDPTASVDDVTPSTTAPDTGASALRTRRFAVTAVTDTQYLVWGGESGPTSEELDHLDGFAVDLESGAVTPIPAAPITEVWTSQGVWTGTELVVWPATSGCDTCIPSVPEAAAWNPTTSTWRSIAPPPGDAVASTVGAVWAGDRIVTATGRGVVATYDPATDQWSASPSIDVAAWAQAALVWTGSEVVYWGAGPGTALNMAVGGPISDRGWRWTPGSATWTPLPDLPEGHRTTRATAVWTGEELVVWGAATGGVGSTDVGVGARWRPGDDAWRPMAPSPQGPGDGFEGTHGSQALGVDPASGQVVVLPLVVDGVDFRARQLLVYDLDADSWRSTPILLVGWDPTIAVADGMILVPDPEAPIAGRL